MFTGLIEAVGVVVRAADAGGAASAGAAAPRRLTLAVPLPVGELAIGDSVALDGCCLTVVAIDAARGELAFEAATETLTRTTLGQLGVGDRVNIERALRLGDRLGGHMVAGHVDGVGTVRTCQARGSAVYLGIEAPPEVIALTCGRGSITVAGVSLTVTDVVGHDFWVALVPHTVQAVNFAAWQPGRAVNLEADMIARYVARLLGLEAVAALARGDAAAVAAAAATAAGRGASEARRDA